MSTKYIVGRPFALGDKNLEPGDELTENDLSEIPRLESWVSMRFVYRVYTGKDYEKLPSYLYSIVQKKQAALAKINASTRSVVGEDEAAAAANAAGAEDHLAKKAASEMEIQDYFYDRVNGKITQPKEDGVKDDKGIERVNPDEQLDPVPTGDDIAEMDEKQAENEDDSNITMSEEPHSFDPGEHTAVEVQEYLEQNPDDKQRVLDLEKDGKARKGILGS